jgi:hypothetical protein
MRLVKIFTFWLAFIFVAGCGGGGGGSSSGGNQGEADYGVRLIHASLEAAPVDLYSSSSREFLPLASSAFLLASPYIALPEGEQVLSLYRAKSSTAQIFSFPVNISKNGRKSVLLLGDFSDNGLGALVFDDFTSQVPADRILVRIVHALNKAGAINVSLAGSNLVTGLKYSELSDYVQFRFTEGELLVRSSTGSQVLYAALERFEAGKAYTLVLGGNQGLFTLLRKYKN